MLRSMTAFARQDATGTFGSLTWELRSVNHRYLECSVRLPEELRSLEAKIKERVSSRLARGKVECNFSFKTASAGNQLNINQQLASALIHQCDELHRQMRNPASISPVDVLKWPGVLEAPSLNLEELSDALFSTLDKALDELVENREREGEKLREALDERRVAMSEIVVQVRARLPQILEWVRQRLQNRFDELNLQLDAERLEQEIVMVAQKTDVEEELKRLETHLHELDRILNDKDGKAVGRRLDFLMQEFNREANTLCSKSIDADTTKAGIDLKVYIEQMREQVQNIE